MKAEELMIGDWVEDTLGVREIRRATIGTLKYLANGAIKPQSILPIPITPEILEKNGFKDGQFFGELLTDGFLIQCDCKNIRIKTEEDELINVPCEYVHELQHALRLCKINKEIEL